jgi:signal transduction histidine kinase
MFASLSLRPLDSDEAAIRSELAMARKGAVSRAIFGVVVSAVSAIWLPWTIAVAFAGLVVLFEGRVRPWLTSLALDRWENDRARLRLFYRATIFASACFYSALPLTGLVSGAMLGWYLVMMSFCSAVISGITYFANDRWQFGACVAPSCTLACAAPFVFHTSPTVSAAVLTLNLAFALSALRSAQHRAELVESIAREAAARQEAENLSVEKSQFIATVSHELRTPLNAIIGYSELLKETAEDEHRDREANDLDKVLQAGRRLLLLINDLLDISKVEAGKMELAATCFSVRDFVTRVTYLVAPTAEANGNRLIVEVEPDAGQAVTDELRLSQCLTNLLSNAAKFTRNGEIVLRVQRQVRPGGDWLEITVADTGIGMSPDQMLRLFEPFIQADASITRAFGGTGLGLTITRRLARMMGGDVTATSQLGRGSTFTLCVPALSPAARRELTANGAEAEAADALAAA